MKHSCTNVATNTTLTSPVKIWNNFDLSDVVAFSIENNQLNRFLGVVRDDFIEIRLGADNKIRRSNNVIYNEGGLKRIEASCKDTGQKRHLTGLGLQSCLFGWRIRMNILLTKREIIRT